jgi:hypothetical protein
MGGFGSGRWRAHTPKTYVEDCRVLQVSECWSSTTTRPHFGGRRHWLVCSSCGSRVSRLYFPEGQTRWACRRCHDLAYASQRKCAVSRAIRSAQKIRETLGGCANLFAPFPERPKGMHWRTYQRLRTLEGRAKCQMAAAFSAWDLRVAALTQLKPSSFQRS